MSLVTICPPMHLHVSAAKKVAALRVGVIYWKLSLYCYFDLLKHLFITDVRIHTISLDYKTSF